MSDPVKLANVNKEYLLLSKILSDNNFLESNQYFIQLYDINLKFWEYHDWQRHRWQSIEPGFVDLELYDKTREEHIWNDQRAQIKKEINTNFGSELVEEKQFIGYSI